MLFYDISRAKKRLKAVLVGCGEQATVIIHTAISLLDEVEVVACCDINQDRAAFTAKRFGLPKYYLDLDEMLEKEKADVAFVISVPKMQAKLVTKCLLAGLNAYVEKPMATELEDCYELLKTAEKSGKKVGLAFNKRYDTAYARMKEGIESEGFGHPSLFKGKFILGYRSTPTDLLRVGAVHFYDLARYMISEIDELFAYKYEKAMGQHMYSVTMQFENGCVGNLSLGSLGFWACAGGEGLEVRGDRNMIVVEDGRTFLWQKTPLTLQSGNTPGQTQAVIEQATPAEVLIPNYSNISKMNMHSFFLNGNYQCIKAFVEAVLNDTETPTGINDGIMSLKIALAIQKSVDEKRVVKISEIY